MKLSTITHLRLAGEVEASAEARKDRLDAEAWAREQAQESEIRSITEDLVEDPVRLSEVYYDEIYRLAQAGEPQPIDVLMAEAMKDVDRLSDEEIGKRFRESVRNVVDAWIEAEAERRVG